MYNDLFIKQYEIILYLYLDSLNIMNKHRYVTLLPLHRCSFINIVKK